MDWEKYANIATVVEAAVVVVTVFFILYELRQNRKLTQASNVQSIVELSSPLNLELIKDREMAEFWISGAERYEKMDSADKYRYKSLLIWWLIMHENIYYQRREKLISDNYYHGWQTDLDRFVVSQKLWRLWPDFKATYQIEFSDYVSAIIKRYQPQDNANGSE